MRRLVSAGSPFLFAKLAEGPDDRDARAQWPRPSAHLLARRASGATHWADCLPLAKASGPMAHKGRAPRAALGQSEQYAN